MSFTVRQPQTFPRPDSLLGPRPRTPHSPLRRRVATAGAAASLLGLGLLGGSQLGSTSSPAATRTPASPPLSARVLALSALPGFMLAADSAPVSSAAEWSRVEGSRTPGQESARLRSLGFAGGFDEQLHGRYPLQADGVSVAERYRTASGASQELAYQYGRLRDPAGGEATTFSVPGIPGARGVRIQSRRSVDLNVLFASGSYYYLVGTGGPSGAHGALGQASLSTAATTLYLTSAGCVADASRKA